jgi:DegV family protein with EDD domain
LKDGGSGSGTLGAVEFAAALCSGFHRIMLDQETLNRINVFPVADGDTGTNLSETCGAALGLLSAVESDHVGELLAFLADCLLDSARGNSGAIVAQFFQGMSDAAEDLAAFDVQSMASTFTAGNEYAHGALAQPREGTILSTMAAFTGSFHLDDDADAEPTITGLLREGRQAAAAALARTQSQLDVLRKAGVVDAGARGFVALVDGLVDHIVDGQSTERPDLAVGDAWMTPLLTAGSEEQLAFRFCTECIVGATDIDRRKLRERLSGCGDSLVLAGSKRKAKIHIHTNDPEGVFAIAREYGDVTNIKADDLERQQHSTHDATARFAVITDSAADIPDEDMEKLDIHMVPCRVQFGDRGYLDKVSITTDEFFDELARNPVPPTTSQPSPGDFRRQFQYLASHFPDVVSINLTPRVSGTLQAARSAAARINAPGNVHVINSANASLGQGLLAVYAAECAAAGLDIETTLRAVQAMIPKTLSFALIRDLGYAVRGGRVPASTRRIADLLRVTPVIRTTRSGGVAAGGILPGRRRLLPKFARYVAKQCHGAERLRIAIGHAVCEDDARKLQDQLLALLPNAESRSITGLGSALGAHGGPGSLVVSFQEYRDPASFT